MDRPKRAATKVTDFRQYHLSGELDEHLKGQVDNTIRHFEMAGAAEDLKKKLEEEKEQSRRLQEEAEILKIQSELESEKLRQKQWQEATHQLKVTQEHVEAEHRKFMEQIKEVAVATHTESSNQAMEWFQAQVSDLHKSKDTNPVDLDRHNRERGKGSRNKRAAGQTGGDCQKTGTTHHR